MPRQRLPVSRAPKRSWFAELRKGLARSSSALSDNLASALTKRKLDEETLDQLEEVLIKADLGVAMAGASARSIADGRYERGLSPEAVRAVLAAEVAQRARASGAAFRAGRKPRSPMSCWWSG